MRPAADGASPSDRSADGSDSGSESQRSRGPGSSATAQPEQAEPPADRGVDRRPVRGGRPAPPVAGAIWALGVGLLAGRHLPALRAAAARRLNRTRARSAARRRSPQSAPAASRSPASTAAQPVSRNVRSAGAIGVGRRVVTTGSPPAARRVRGAARISSAVARQVAQVRVVVGCRGRNSASAMPPSARRAAYPRWDARGRTPHDAPPTRGWPTPR